MCFHSFSEKIIKNVTSCLCDMKDGCKNTGVSAQACGRVCFTDREKADYWIYRSCNFIELIWYSSMLQSPGLFCIMYNGSSKVLSCITYSNSILLPDGSLSGTLFYSWCQILSLFSPFSNIKCSPPPCIYHPPARVDLEIYEMLRLHL